MVATGAATAQESGSTTIRIPRVTHDRLKALAAESGEQITEIVNRAVEAEARRRFMRRYNDAYARLKSDPSAWAAHAAEMAEWEGTLADGLDVDDDWGDLLAAGIDGVEFVEVEEIEGGDDGTPR
jgi:hypothetical protein